MKKVFICVLLLVLLVGCTKPKSFSLSATEMTIERGEAHFLPLVFHTLTIADIQVVVSADGIVEVEGDAIQGIELGVVTITFTYGKLQATLDVTVVEVTAHLSILSPILEVGKSAIVNIVNFPDPSLFSWELNHPEIASLSETYILLGLMPGEVSIHVVLMSNPAIIGDITIEIIPVRPILYGSRSLLEVGDAMQLLISDPYQSPLSSFDWVIADPMIVALDANYQITALKEGTTFVSITSKSNSHVTASFEITIANSGILEEPVSEVTTGPLYVRATNNTGIVTAGEVLDIEVLGRINPYGYRYQSSDATIVGITDTGKVFGIKAGIAKIHVISKLNPLVRGSLTVTVIGTPNVNYPARIIAAGLGEEGYVEGYDNDNKYGEWFDYPNVAWCAIFVSWCANQAGIGIDVVPKYSSVSGGMIWFDEQGLFQHKENYTPKAGDIIFFASDGASHTGIVVTCDGLKVYTIEGNTSNGVHQRSYDLSYSQITGYGTPNYPPHQ